MFSFCSCSFLLLWRSLGCSCSWAISDTSVCTTTIPSASQTGQIVVTQVRLYFLNSVRDTPGTAYTLYDCLFHLTNELEQHPRAHIRPFYKFVVWRYLTNYLPILLYLVQGFGLRKRGTLLFVGTEHLQGKKPHLSIVLLLTCSVRKRPAQSL